MRLMTVTDSDMIEAVGYDPDGMRLGVVFKSSPSTIFGYECSHLEFSQLISAESIGKHFHATFRRRAFTKSVRPPTLQK